MVETLLFISEIRKESAAECQSFHFELAASDPAPCEPVQNEQRFERRVAMETMNEIPPLVRFHNIE